MGRPSAAAAHAPGPASKGPFKSEVFEQVVNDEPDRLLQEIKLRLDADYPSEPAGRLFGQHSAFIDAGAVFKGIPRQKVACLLLQKVAEYDPAGHKKAAA